MSIEDDDTNELDIDSSMNIVHRHAHKASFENKADLKKSGKCGCFFCLEIYDPKIIKDYCQDRNGDTAICPFCFTDAVIGDASGFPVTKEFLKKMRKAWF